MVRAVSLPSPLVSIPQSEFCPLGRGDPWLTPTPGDGFQFLSRNSVRWDESGSDRDQEYHNQVSIPQSEFCPLGPGGAFSCCASLILVSIPQSEFCPLGLVLILPASLSIDTNAVSIPQSEFCPLGPSACSATPGMRPRFQFLSRNSVRWDYSRATGFDMIKDVSIPQSEFCPLGLDHGHQRGSGHCVSIPQSEFCPLGLDSLSALDTS